MRKKFDKLPTPYEFFAEGMIPFLSEDHASAFAVFDRAANYYFLQEYLPYYAFSASIVGRADHIWTALAAREPMLDKIRRSETSKSSNQGFRFDEDLTYAVLHGLAGRTQESIKYLQSALHDRPFTEARTVFTFYQIVDLADRLNDKTGELAYRDFALDLARRHTQIQPMHAWAYFVVAKLSTDRQEQLVNASVGFRLDPLSHRGSELPQELQATRTD